MKLLANKHIFSLIGAVIGVLAGIVFSRALVLILDWNWKTITLINLATYIFIITIFVYIFVYLLPFIFEDKVAWPCIASFILLLIILPFLVPFLVPGVDYYTVLFIMSIPFIIFFIIFIILDYLLTEEKISIFISSVDAEEVAWFTYLWILIAHLIILPFLVLFLVPGVDSYTVAYSYTLPSVTISITIISSIIVFIILVGLFCLNPIIILPILALIYTLLVSLEIEHKLITPEAFHPLITTLLIPILLISAIAGYYIIKALYSLIENFIKKRILLRRLRLQ